MVPAVVWDTCAARYLLNAIASDYHPDEDERADLRLEKVAAFRLLVYAGNNHLTPTASREIDQSRRDGLDRLRNCLLPELTPVDDQAAVEARARKLVEHHRAGKERGWNDCLIVAEAEATLGIKAVLTLDRAMREDLGPVACVVVTTASDWWDRLKVPSSARPKWTPDLRRLGDWWRL